MENLLVFFSSNREALLWLLATVVLVIIEASTSQMLCIWFALGAISAVFAAMLGAPGVLQFIIFGVVSVVTLIFTRRFVMNALHVEKTATNADSVIGLSGSVIEEINNQEQTGRIRIGGLDWAARSTDGSVIHIGDTVVAQAIEGVKLKVSRKP